jgi:hypothetical protein
MQLVAMENGVDFRLYSYLWEDSTEHKLIAKIRKYYISLSVLLFDYFLKCDSCICNKIYAIHSLIPDHSFIEMTGTKPSVADSVLNNSQTLELIVLYCLMNSLLITNSYREISLISFRLVLNHDFLFLRTIADMSISNYHPLKSDPTN